jgi:GNAT superfamily N-acetyltransferase
MHENLERRPFKFTIRMTGIADADMIAFHRAAMFRDMGILPESDFQDFQNASANWLRPLVASGTYVGWFVEEQRRVIAGGGVFLQPVGPAPGCPHETAGAHVANVYTDPRYRRQGIARWLMQTILDWCEANHIEHVTLTASDAGRPLYEALGFEQTAHMKLKRQFQPKKSAG